MNREFLRARYSYDPSDKTFPLVYIKGTIHHKRARKDRAGSYRTSRGGGAGIKIEKANYALHRIVWSYFNGEIPDGYTIDHKNGDVFDNRIENLLLKTNAENKALGTTDLYSNNKSGMTGVLFDSNQNKWKVSFRHKNNLYYFGIFKDLEVAKNVCREKKKELGVISRRK